MSDRRITKENLLSALQSMQSGKSKRKDAAWYVAMIETNKVNFHPTSDDEQTIRRTAPYLGNQGLNDLIAAIRMHYRATERTNPLVSAPPPVGEKDKPTGQAKPATLNRSTELVGISGTGVTARVSTVRVENFGSPSTSISLTVENTSGSGTITNIGVFVKVASKPIEGSKITVPGEITPPGYYRFTNADLAIQTPLFKAICAFAFLTSGSSSFHNGNINGGIPPGQSTRFSFAGDRFLGDITSRQLERGIILRFQGIGNDSLDDIALYPNPDVLFSVSDPIYQISKVTPK